MKKIYTRAGDLGETRLAQGRLPKTADRLEALGTLDELNATLGWMLAAPLPRILENALKYIQSLLFEIGAEVAAPGKTALLTQDTDYLERLTDTLQAQLPALNAFILPRGSEPIARGHLARSVCRRAERRVVALPDTPPHTLSFLNRLSDFLFIATRYLAQIQSTPEPHWHKRQWLAVTHYPGLSPYTPVYEAMRAYTASRDAHSPDQLWVLEHCPVYTLGQAASLAHLHDAQGIAVCRVDRGGQITYHGPGQLIVYTLVDLNRRKLSVRRFIDCLEDSVIACAAEYGIAAQRIAGQPGVYVQNAKLASLGLRIRRGCAYHGLSLNIDLDLAPFERINPCGYAGLRMTRLCDLGVTEPAEAVSQRLLYHLQHLIGAPDLLK